MRARVPALVALGVAVVVSGSTTGTTLAAWRDQSGAAGGSVGSGSFSFDIQGASSSTVVPLGTLPELGRNFGSEPGNPEQVSTVVNYSMSGKNNTRMALSITAVTATRPELRTELEAAGSVVAVGATCPAATSGSFARLDGPGASVPLGTISGTGSGSRRLCLSLRARGGAPAGVAGKSGTVVLTLTASQVRP